MNASKVDNTRHQLIINGLQVDGDYNFKKSTLNGQLNMYLNEIFSTDGSLMLSNAVSTLTEFGSGVDVERTLPFRREVSELSARKCNSWFAPPPWESQKAIFVQ